MSNQNENLFEQLLAIEEACRQAQRQVQDNSDVNETGKLRIRFLSHTFYNVGQLSDINQNRYSLFKTLRQKYIYTHLWQFAANKVLQFPITQISAQVSYQSISATAFRLLEIQTASTCI